MNNIHTDRMDGNEQATLEILRLVTAITRGHLDARGDAARFTGAQAELVTAVNRMLDALVAPLRVASNALERIAHGSVPDFVIEEYQGEFNEIKTNVNTFLATMYGMHHEIGNFVQSIKNGRLQTRANHWDYAGKWRDLIEGLNEVIDTFMDPFQVAAEYIRSISRGEIPAPVRAGYRGDFNEMRRSLNTLIAAVNAVIADIDRLCTAAIAGELATRVNASRHGGDFRRIVDGVNRTMDGVVGPLEQSAVVLAHVAAGDLRAELEGDYRGDFAKLQRDINAMVGNLRGNLLGIGQTAEKLATASSQLEGISRRLTANADETSARADVAASAGKSVSRHVELAVKGSETISCSVQETVSQAEAASQDTARTTRAVDAASEAIGKLGVSSNNIGAVIQAIGAITEQIGAMAREADQQAVRAAEAGRGFGVVAEEVKRLAQRTRDAADEIGGRMRKVQGACGAGKDMQDLAGYAHEIGQVAGVIDRLGMQIHLLSLNASIEAARAEDAGQRFGHVAAGVKALAAGTAKAAGDMAPQLEAIQTDSQTAVSVMGQITGMVHRIDSASEAITRAVERQAAITEEVRQSLVTATDATRDVVESVSAVTAAAQSTADAASDTQAAATSLSGMAEGLQELVGNFKV